MRVTVIPEDQTIIVDGEALKFAFLADPHIHAIQWYGDHGTIEKKVGGAEWFNDSAVVQPFVNSFLSEKQRIADELAAQQAEQPTQE